MLVANYLATANSKSIAFVHPNLGGLHLMPHHVTQAWHTQEKGKHLATKKLVNEYAESIGHNCQKVETTQRPSTDEWINTMWSLHTVEYYLVDKKE